MMPLSSKQDRSKRMAAARAIEEVEDGMILGLGSGSTAAFAIEALAARIAKGLRRPPRRRRPWRGGSACRSRASPLAASMLRSTAPIHEPEKHAWPVQGQQS
jgi:hypothetical protein